MYVTLTIKGRPYRLCPNYEEGKVTALVVRKEEPTKEDEALEYVLLPLSDGVLVCNCPAFEQRQHCKHGQAVAKLLEILESLFGKEQEKSSPTKITTTAVLT